MPNRFPFSSLLAGSFLLSALATVVVAQERGELHSFRLRDVELRAALDSLLRWYRVPLVYLELDVAGKRVTVECRSCSFEEALGKMVEGQGLIWKVAGRQVLLQRAAVEPEVRIATVAGAIKDSLTGEALFGADVLLFSRSAEPVRLDEEPAKVYRWCSTNQFGFFSLRNIEPGDYILHVRRIGYRAVSKPIRIEPGSIIRDVEMIEQGVEYREITIEGRRSVFSASEGISRGVYIRAAPSDHNQYLLEGARVYNPLHFGGVMSSFNGDALRDVQLVAGGVPPYYGGRIGGILDIVLRDGDERRLKGSATVGSLGSNLLLEGPASGEISFLLSGRRGYPDALLPRYRTVERPSDLRFTEVMAKLTHKLSRDQRLSLSGFFGHDTYGSRVSSQSGSLSNSLRWGNSAVNLRWIGVVSPSLFFSASGMYTRYGFDVEHRLDRASVRETFVSDYRIVDAAVRAHAEYFYDQHHTVVAGVELVRHRLSGRISEFSSQVAPMSFTGFAPWELSVYVQDQWRLVPSVSAGLGARATSFIAKQGSFSAVDPRFSLLVSLRDDLRLHTSLSAVNQLVHPYRHSGIFLFYPSIFLYPSTDDFRPSACLQVSLGMEKSIQDDRYRLAVESYYRTTQNLHEFVYDTIAARTLSDALLVGEGNIYGADITLDKRLGEITGSLRYSFSWASNRFAGLNDGAPFRPRFDRRHEIYGTISYSPHEGWTVGAVFLLSSNQFPSFAPSGLKTLEAASPNARDRWAFAEGAPYAEPYDLNGGRLPGFQRIELRAQHRSSWWGLQAEVTLRLLNGYGLVDPFVWELRQNPDNRSKWRATFDAPPLFPLYPVVSVGARF